MATLALALIALLALPMAVLAGSSGSIAQTGGMTTTLPLLGSSLTVDVTLDAAGNLSSVTLDPVGTSSASKVSAHAVTFDSADGTTQVRIKARGDKLSVKASAGTLDALVGPGTWSADVFGTGARSSVAYTVGKAADGSPTLALGTVDAAAGITAAAGTPTTRAKGHGARASAAVTFTRDGYTKRLTITVSVRAKGGNHPAGLEIRLSGKDRQKLTGPLADLAGAHTWSGATCDGSPIGIAYTVNADGTVTYDSATGGTATVKARDHGFSARFDGTKVRVNVGLRQAKDGTSVLTASATRRCGPTNALPTVNTPVKAGADAPADHKDGSPKDGGHRQRSHGHGGSRHHGGSHR